MLKRNITYTDFNDQTVTETFYFNLSKAELVEMEMSIKGGLGEQIKEMIAAEDNPKLIALFKRLVLEAYGVKSDDGKRFIKSEQLREEFTQTNAYSELFMELATNNEAAAIFLNGILPKDVAVEVNKMTTPTVPEHVHPTPAPPVQLPPLPSV
jgi:hypothetical protein